jgi:hypothetical protein
MTAAQRKAVGERMRKHWGREEEREEVAIRIGAAGRNCIRNHEAPSVSRTLEWRHAVPLRRTTAAFRDGEPS